MKNPLHALNNYHKASDNSAVAMKVHLRQKILSLADRPVSVLDCYAGDGVMRQRCYEGLEYVGIDIRQGVDNLEYAQASTLEKYNFFDLDAYGSPLPLLEIIASKCKTPSYFVLTDGARLHVQTMHRLPFHIQPYVKGGDRRSDGWYRAYPGIVKMCVLEMFAKRDVSVRGYQQYTGLRKHVLYIGFVAC